MKIIEKYVLPDGLVVDELSPDEERKFQQKIIDAFAPLVYERMMKELGDQPVAEKELA